MISRSHSSLFALVVCASLSPACNKAAPRSPAGDPVPAEITSIMEKARYANAGAKWGLVVLDVEPSVGDTLCKLVKKQRKQTPVLMFSNNGDGEGVLKRWFGKAPDGILKKPVVMELVGMLGFEPVDAGPLKNARLLEPFAMVWIDQAMKRGRGRDFAFALVQMK